MCENLDNVDMIRMVNLGIEVIMSVVKFVRGYIKRDKIVKFVGCYYGYFDGFLIEVGFGVMINGILGLFGVLIGSIENILIGKYNDKK